jgi:hypothetical protein
MPAHSFPFRLPFLVTVLLIGIPVYCHQTDQPEKFRLMFYNTENFFDPFDDSLNTGDDEYLPSGDRHWTWNRYQAKLNNLYKVIVSVGGWEPPAIIGLCEVENRRVVNDLIWNTPLVKFPYGILHHESPDKRGIDVAMLYRKDIFKPIASIFIPIDFPDRPGETTRDILYAKGLLGGDTLHLFINHWPSRSGGQNETDNKRFTVSRILKLFTDSIMRVNPEAKIVITGDFNDGPEDASIHEGLAAATVNEINSTRQLVDLSSQFAGKAALGSHKFQGEWTVLDQFIVSCVLLKTSDGLYCRKEDVHIFNADFLLERDDQYLGMRPKRTYNGFLYAGGFSDHLPVYLDIHSGNQ